MTVEQVNWVKGKADCNIEGAFLALYHQAAKDVKDANNLPDSIRGRCTFKISEFGALKMSFSVALILLGNPTGHSTNFCVKSGEIIINQLKDRKYGDEFIVKCQWNEHEGKCMLVIDNQPHELWQISQRALSPLFFSEINVRM